MSWMNRFPTKITKRQFAVGLITFTLGSIAGTLWVFGNLPLWVVVIAGILHLTLYRFFK